MMKAVSQSAKADPSNLRILGGCLPKNFSGEPVSESSDNSSVSALRSAGDFGITIELVIAAMLGIRGLSVYPIPLEAR